MMGMKRIALTLIALSALTAVQAAGQDKLNGYPGRPIRFIVPFAPGGGTDIIGRALAQKLTGSLGQTVVVDNRGGAGGAIGSEMGVRATPDGYTLTMAATSYAANAALLKLPYDPVADISLVSLVGHGPFVVVLNPGIPATNIEQLISLAKSRPGTLNYGTSGTGSITHLGTELFCMLTQTQMVHVPYKGTGPALNDIIGGQIQLMLASAPSARPQVQSKRLRAVAVTSLKRSQAMPAVPTVSESGVPNYEVLVWYAVYGPRGLPKPIVQLWSKAISEAVESPDFKSRLAAEAVDAIGGPPDAFGDLLRRDIARWKSVVKQANIQSAP
jgi:tripartite-type tricarboxylate transporter receptor subunit TctC